MKVGDYVRTKNGYIGKTKIVPEYNVNIEDKIVVEIKDIIKSSPNILELLRVGDFINGKQIVKIIHFEGDTFYRIELFGGKAIMNIKDIKSIVTKEQFESMEYKVGVDKD